LLKEVRVKEVNHFRFYDFGFTTNPFCSAARFAWISPSKGLNYGLGNKYTWLFIAFGGV